MLIISWKTVLNPVQTSEAKERYAYLELEEVQDALLDFREKGCAKITITIPSIHCSSCVYLLEHLPRINPAIKAVIVDFVKREAAITYNDDELSLRQLIELLAKIGYTPDLSQDKKAGQTKQKSNQRLVLKIGLAGFCFGNIMLLSFPEYFMLEEGDLVEYQAFLEG